MDVAHTPLLCEHPQEDQQEGIIFLLVASLSPFIVERSTHYGNCCHVPNKNSLQCHYVSA